MADHGEFTNYAPALLWAFGNLHRWPVNVRFCLRCGATVVDEEKHDIFHTQVDSIL